MYVHFLRGRSIHPYKQMIAMNKNHKVKLAGKARVWPHEVVRLDSDLNYTWIKLKNGNKLYVSYTLKKVSERLAESGKFYRINRQTVVNCSFIEAINDKAVLVNGLWVAFSRRKKAGILHKLNQHSSISF